MSKLWIYVDGFNFYYGLHGRNWHRYGWCDFRKLVLNTCSPTDDVKAVKYFTARDDPNPFRQDRQIHRWWKALEYSGVKVFQGIYREHDQVDPYQKSWTEKKTDVALAVEMIFDAFTRRDEFDRAVLVSRDEDFIPAVEKLTSESLRKSVLVLLPPRNESLRVYRPSPYFDMVSRQVTVKEIVLEDLKKALLPRRVVGPHGDWAECFHLWKCRDDIEAERVRTMARNTTPSKISRK